ncbi:MAG: hypothetical protein CMP11_02790 [Zetaproteobacteria bacterium]|nr:hypothetical protein [Pseudobdellovibrionaceae bacterium]|tara:strand:+ start:1685 stop:2332 length:648 start_codon:yes stop_codon:yes gene_type:complete
MNALKDKINELFSQPIVQLKEKVFGRNNENIDFIIDSFYKLQPEQRTGALFGAAALVLFFIGGLLSLYFYNVNSLDKELNQVSIAYGELTDSIVEFQVEKNKFNSLVELIRKKTQGLNMKPFFESLSNEKKVDMKGLNVERVERNSNDPLSDEIEEKQIDFKLAKISIPRLLNFLIEAEKSDKFIRLKQLKITGMYGNRLYFDSTVSFVAFNMAK